MIEAAKVPERLGRLIVSPKAYAKQKPVLAGFQWLRANLPIGRVEIESFDPFWAVTKHADILEVSRRHDVFHNGDRATTLVPRAADERARALTGGSPHLVRSIVHMDEPDHLKYRRITHAWFAQQKVQALEHRIRAIARECIDRMAAHGTRCDFAQDVARHFPLRVLMEIIGVPEEDESFILKLTQKLFDSEDEELTGGCGASADPARHAKQLCGIFAEFRGYFARLTEARRKAPRDDVATVIANAEIDGKPISRFEEMSYFVIIATAGHDTTSSSISGAVWALCENMDEFRKIKADVSLVPKLVEEAVRWTTPVQHFMRTATAETALRGRRIAKNDWLMLCYISGNRDEDAFEQPDRFRVDRNSSPNVAFGHGVHVCLGQHLARLEMRIFFEELFARLAWIEMAGEPRRSASVFVGGPKTLPVRFGMN
ncbi:MAG TPA: cytochrome P450 [Xanthobacteraceae bacterium]